MINKLNFLKETGTQGESLQLTGSTGAPGPVPTLRDEHVVQQDLWTIHQGEGILDRSTVLQEIFNMPVDKLREARHGFGGLTDEETDALVDAKRTVTDFFTAAFERSVQLNPNPMNKKLSRFLSALLSTEDFHRLRMKTVGSRTLAGIVCRILSQQYVDVISQRPDGEPGNGDPIGPDGGISEQELEDLGDAADALKEAEDQVKDCENAQRTLGGIGAGSSSNMEIDEVQKLFARVKNSTHLNNIMRRAGAFRLEAMGLQENKIEHGHDEVIGITESGDVSQLLPVELFKLGDPDFGDDAVRRLAEKQCQSRELHGVDKLGGGSIVIVVDESGSMDGEPIWNAKAIALALYWIAKTQGRFLCLCGFSGGTSGTFLVIPPGENKDAQLLEWLEHFFDGGTSCDVPLKQLPARWDELGMPSKKTDMIVITDDYIEIPTDVEETFNEWRKENRVKVQTLILSERGRQQEEEEDEMVRVSDIVHHIDNLSVEQSAVKGVLSV